MSDDPDKEGALLDRVLLLTATYEYGSHYGDPGGIQDAFMYVLKRFPFHIAAEAIDRFMMGRGDGQLPGEMPTAAEVAVECRQLVYLEEAIGFDAGGDLGSPVVRQVEDDIHRIASVGNITPFRRPRHDRDQGPIDPKGAA